MTPLPPSMSANKAKDASSVGADKDKSMALDEGDIKLLQTYVRSHFSLRSLCRARQRVFSSRLTPTPTPTHSLPCYLQGLGPYTRGIKKLEKDIEDEIKKIIELIGIKESDMGLAPPSQWDIVADTQMIQEEGYLHVARCTKIINPGQEDAK